jgi:hypothetical protein
MGRERGVYSGRGLYDSAGFGGYWCHGALVYLDQSPVNEGISYVVSDRSSDRGDY